MFLAFLATVGGWIAFTSSSAGAAIPPVAAISEGFSHVCALSTAGGVRCWGFNGAGQLATVLGRFTYERIDQQVVDGAVNGSAAAAESGGQLFRKLTSGRVQQYGALLFAAAAVFAGVFILFV